MSEIELLTPEQVAARLQVKTRTVQEWLRAGKLVGLKLGKMWRVRPVELERFLRGTTLAGTAEPRARSVREFAAAGEGMESNGSAAPREEVDDGNVMERLIALADRLIAEVPEEEWKRLPEDLAEQHDHYIYGLPKRTK